MSRRRARSSSASTSSTQPRVLGQELVPRLPLALDQRAADEQLARQRRVDPPVLHRPVGDDRQPVQRHALGRDDRAARSTSAAPSSCA